MPPRLDMTILTNMSRRVDPKDIKGAAWTVAEAKACFSELVARARAGKPQRVTRYGKEEVVVVSAEDWRQLLEKSTSVDGREGQSLWEATVPFRHADPDGDFAAIMDRIVEERGLQPLDPKTLDE